MLRFPTLFESMTLADWPHLQSLVDSSQGSWIKHRRTIRRTLFGRPMSCGLVAVWPPCFEIILTMIKDILVRTATYDLLREQSCCESSQFVHRGPHLAKFPNSKNRL